MILETVQRTIEHYKLLSQNQTLIIGVSGGTDSLALLHMMKQIQSKLEINLHVATLNHGIRGQAGKDDTQFVKTIAEQWDIPYTVGHADVPHLAQQIGTGIEVAARQARYDFFAKVADQIGSAIVAVAHHEDDQAETILMHIIRGSGLNGLQGMRPKLAMPYHSHLTLIRPLLYHTRSELEHYCIQYSLNPRYDNTNDDLDFQRNFIRQTIMPQLKQLNPNLRSGLVRLGENASIDQAYINSQLADILTHHIEKNDKRWRMPSDIFADLHPALQRRYLIQAFNQLNQSKTQLSSETIVNAIHWLGQAQVGGTLDLGGAIRLRVGYDSIMIEDSNQPYDSSEYRLIPADTYLALSIPSTTTLANIIITIADAIEEEDSRLTVMDLPDGVSIVLRTRHEGDKFRPSGMDGHSRKIKDWMIDRKIPRHFRNNIPLVCINDTIIAVCVGNTWHLADISQFIVKQTRRIYLILN